MVCCSIQGPPIERLTWADPSALARALRTAGLKAGPAAQDERDLRAMIAALPGFDDDPAAAAPCLLQAVRSALDASS
jgi:FeS assembly protein IscX